MAMGLSPSDCPMDMEGQDLLDPKSGDEVRGAHSQVFSCDYHSVMDTMLLSVGMQSL